MIVPHMIITGEKIKIEYHKINPIFMMMLIIERIFRC
jgi:hypothetical protein